MSLTVRPQREDFFPRLRRGHGSINAGKRERADDGAVIVVRKSTLCVEPTCCMNSPKSKITHIDTAANMRDWCEEHGLSIRAKDHPNAEYPSAAAAMFASTGGK